MSSAARILIIGEQKDKENDLSTALHTKGFETYTGSITESAAEVSGKRRPDIVVLNMDSDEAQSNPKAFLALARTLKHSSLSSRMRVLMVGTNATDNLEGVEKNLDDLLLGPIKTLQVCHRINSLIRLNTMHEELVRRLNTSAKYGVDAPPPILVPQTIDDAKILFMGDAKGYASIENALYKTTTLIGALTFNTAIDYLNRSSFDTILIDAGDKPENYMEFARDIRRNSQFFNLPILMLVNKDVLEDPTTAYDNGITDIIEKPVSQQELKLRAMSLIREHRFRTSLRQIYKTSKHFATNDALTGLYTRGFMYEHLSDMIQDIQKSSQTFSLAAIRIKNMKQINEVLGYASGDRLIRQIGELISLLVRGEDLACRYSSRRFVIILPDTSAKMTTNALKRIIGVVHHTEFAIQGYNHPVSVALDTGITGYQDGDTPDSIIERTWRTL
ncbi:MAG: diguanylate cyclase [Pseudomonadota bacterium]